MNDTVPVRFSGIAAALPLADIDTDTITPIEYCINRQRPHFDEGLFRHWRYFDDGSERADFVLNDERLRRATILVTGPNFGCGSSREMAVWALADFGFRCVIAPSFGEIFYNNCFQNNVLAARVSPSATNALIEIIRANPGESVTIDIAHKHIHANGEFVADFALDDLRAQMLLEGLDPIAATLTRARDIEKFEARDKSVRPWVWQFPT